MGIVTGRKRRSWLWIALVACAAVYFLFAAIYWDDSKARSSSIAWGVLLLYMGVMSYLDSLDPERRGGSRWERWTYIAETSGNAALKGAVTGVYLGITVGLVAHSFWTGVLFAFALAVLLTPLAIFAQRRRTERIERRNRSST